MNIPHHLPHTSIKGIYMTSPKIRPTRLLIADGDPLVCRALARLFPNGSGVEVVATWSDSSEVLELAGHLNPAVVLVDAHTGN